MEYKCKICNKQYSSYQSLWIHNKKYHSIKFNNNTILAQKKNVISQAQNFISQAQNIISQAQNSIAQEQNKHYCKFCKKNFVRNYCVIRHEKKCKTKINEITIIKEENDKLKEQLKNNSKIELKNNESLNNHLIDIISDKKPK